MFPSNILLVESVQTLLSSPYLPKSLVILGQYLPLAAKWICLTVLAANFRSWPFVWLFRVFLPVFYLRLRLFVFNFRHILHSAKKRKIKRREWLEALSPIGRNPFDHVTSYRTWAGFDDCDYNFHLSNSSYAKTLDMARMKAALEHFPAYLRTGGFLVLGATHFTYIREIPMLSRYETRVSIASWDNKWLYLVVRFVTFPKFKDNKATPTRESMQPSTVDTPPLSNPHTPPSGISTPLKSASAHPNAAAALDEFARRNEPDGAVLNCISINEFVVKQGRITVPPALALACDGYCAPSTDGTAYSIAKPPPHWKHVRAILENGGMKAMRAFLSGGWKDVPEGERWWEQALSGPVEAQRVANLALVGGVRTGMEGAREIVSLK